MKQGHPVWRPGGGLESRLRTYAELLSTYARPLGLVGPDEISSVWDRHILDSLRGLACLRPSDQEIIDVGSGAGLPGIPLALACPDRHFRLVEAARRKAAFLELVVEKLGLPNANVLVTRVEDADVHADACLARAFAPPVETWISCSRLLDPGGQVLYYAGRSWNVDTLATLAQAGVNATICRPAEHEGEGHIVSMVRSDPPAEEVNEDL